ncbi:Tn7 transposase TnsA N-terminal domain-containing protein [Defluviimonas sp. WL0024]|uniref:Tn7 transposase TnsA N-terminal domain-containing protein n=1 Tax=Albidovulum salinarum TaxID=2984153 RepID=A0ABT2X4V5_9RHOB|nr:Tn7 transposase TnsA N-terminal domain-containing protein [Defluviimonas sp. WL0024]MCU9848971.1 Tn7 transposase TnsA N-terminal domain-containing protein [Defluviimonas sp. WL0024]
MPEESTGDRDTQVASTKHFTGCGVFGDGPGVRTGLESHLEGNAVLLMVARPDTLEVREQVLFEWFDEFGEFHDHYIDFVVIRKDGKVIGYAVRPMERVSQRYLLKLSRIKQQAIERGFLDDFRLFSDDDVCPVELFNAKLFHSVRRPDPFGDPVAQGVVRGTVGVVTIEDLVARIGLDGMGFRAIIRLIRSGHLRMVHYERITYRSMVFKAKEV